MKKLAAAAVIIITALTVCACGESPVDAQATVSAPVSATVAEDSAAAKADVGFCLADRGAFSDKLIEDIESECASLKIKASVTEAASAGQQREDLSEMLNAEPSVIVVDPVDVDSLETELAECDVHNVQVINVVDPVNGKASMLISPNYTAIGEKAGQCALDALASGGGCMLLGTEYDSFTMQLMTDGFNSKVEGNGGISVVSEQFCGTDEEKAYETVKAELSKDIAFIFAQSPELGRGAIRAVKESGKDVKIAVFGGDMDIIGAVSSGEAFAAIFCAPGALAREAVSQASQFLASESYVPPQYSEIPVTVVKQADAPSYYAEGEIYAEAK